MVFIPFHVLISAKKIFFETGITKYNITIKAAGNETDNFTNINVGGYNNTSAVSGTGWMSIYFEKGFITDTPKLFMASYDGNGNIEFQNNGYDYVYKYSANTINFVSKTKIGGANIYDLTNLTVEQETAIYNEMVSASTWDSDASIYKYTGDGQFQLRYTDGTIINFTSFYWVNRPARWMFYGEFIDTLGRAYTAEYGLYGDESSEPWVEYYPNVKFNNDVLTYYTGNTTYNVVDSTDIKHVKVMTSAEYSALTNKNNQTLYCIKG